MKIKPERIAGVVALSYLVLIPAAGAIMWRRQTQIANDVDYMWANQGLDTSKSARQTPGEMLRSALSVVK